MRSPEVPGRRRAMKRFLVVGAILSLIPQPLYAWHNRGHMSVARVAWQQLVDKGLEQKAIAILDKHPHKDNFLKVARPNGVSEEEWMFVQAATWPDWVRDPFGPGIDHHLAGAIKA